MKNKERKVSSLFSYLRSELTRGYMQECDELLYSEKHRRVSTFMQTPRELEKIYRVSFHNHYLWPCTTTDTLMMFGFSICLDSFLFVITFLPIRVFLAVFTIMSRPLCCRSMSLEAAQICDILKALIIVVCVVAMTNVDTSVAYHMVRGQSFIKLYVIINVLEIFDRLLASIGQDTLDTLYWVAIARKSQKRDYLKAVFYFFVANVYVFLHTVLALFQAVTLNVAMNSHSNILLTILISNQFVELKGNVFKKFETDNLFQMSCSDIRERFHIVILLTVVSVRNLVGFNWDLGHLETLVPLVLMVLCSEMFVDWVKHAFITKFNDIQPEVYRKYRSILAKDLATSRYKNSRGDHSDLVSRRVGFIPLPLVCLVWHTFSRSFHIHGYTGILLIASIFLFLVSLKVLIGVLLLGMVHSYQYCNTDTHISSNPATGQQLKSSESHTSDVLSSTKLHSPQESKENLLENIPASYSIEETKEELFLKQKKHRPKKPLAEIERYTLCSHRIV